MIEYGKINENFAIFNIIKLCKTNKLQVPFLSLNIDTKVMKNLVQFMLENTQVNFDESFCSSLSEDNKNYLKDNYCVVSRQNSSVLKFKEELENSEFADSKSINTKSFIKVETSIYFEEEKSKNNETNDFIIIK